MTRFQENAIKFVARHGCGFAIPSADGSVFVFTLFTRAGVEAVDVNRDRAENGSEVRAILGY